MDCCQDQKANSTAQELPNTEPQAPASIPVKQADVPEWRKPLNEGGEPNGPKGRGSRSL